MASNDSESLDKMIKHQLTNNIILRVFAHKLKCLSLHDSLVINQDFTVMGSTSYRLQNIIEYI